MEIELLKLVLTALSSFETRNLWQEGENHDEE